MCTILTFLDEEILIELSQATVGKTNKERHRYREGLRAVLQQMRADQIDDFETVSLRIVEYRRSCLEDATSSVSSTF